MHSVGYTHRYRQLMPGNSSAHPQSHPNGIDMCQQTVQASRQPVTPAPTLSQRLSQRCSDSRGIGVADDSQAEEQLCFRRHAFVLVS